MLLLACHRNNTCITYQGLEWCTEGSAEIFEANGMLKIEDKKDGLFFAADIRFDELDEAGIVRKEREIESNLERYKLTEYWKGGLAFYDFSTMEPPLSDLSQSEIISGDIIAMKSNGAFTIEYRGVNKNKVKRFLDLLME